MRFLVPLDLRGQVGSRFLVRPLHLRPGDAARLVSAYMGMALSNAFQALRQGKPVDLDEVLRRIREQGLRELTLTDVTLPNGTRLGKAQIDTPEDAALFAELLQLNGPLEEIAPAKPSGWRTGKTKASGPLLSKAIVDHLGDLGRAKLHSKTVLESRHSLRLFAGAVGQDLAVSELTADHVRAFFDVVRWWPSNATKRAPYRGLAVMEVVALAQANQVPEPAAWTVAKHRQRLSVFLVSLVSAGLLASNPLAGIRAISTPDADDTGEPFTDDQLKAVFDPVAFPAWAKKYPHRWFGPMLGLYSGARVNEIAQLRVDDIDTIDGVPGFFVRQGGKGQSVKNKNSRRFVPLAKPVIDAGFLVYIDEVRQAGHTQIFPHLPNSTGLGFGRQLSRQFSVYIKRQGITAKGQGFHGFRHTIASRLDEAGVSASAIAAITGHARGQGVLEKFYIDRRTLPDRVATLAKFSPLIKMPIYRSKMFPISNIFPD